MKIRKYKHLIDVLRMLVGVVTFVVPLSVVRAQDANVGTHMQEKLDQDAKASTVPPVDAMREFQSMAVKEQKATWGHWGHLPDRFSTWVNHSNRLIPVYTFGITLGALREEGSAYADADRIEKLYGTVPDHTINPSAMYFDQTDIYRLQQAAVDAGKKNIIVMVFDGTDWQTTRATALYKAGKLSYDSGRGTGLLFQDYRSVPTDYGYVVTSPRQSGAKFDVNSQVVLSGESDTTGGYDVLRGGKYPWREQSRRDYLLGVDRERPHSVTDSAASATSLFSGIKTYNGAINFAVDGTQVTPIARTLQRERGFRVGVVTSVPVSHATPGAAYANNVSRSDYQDIGRDMVGRPSASHRNKPLSGVDVLIGGGWGEGTGKDNGQGDNFAKGNKYLHEEDIRAVDIENGGKYLVSQRRDGQCGRDQILRAAKLAAERGQRFLGFYGTKGGHLPFQTADGRFNPTFDVKGAEKYSQADLEENPTLADMTQAALVVLEKGPKGFWLMIEAGDVDWANHSNNLDNSIGAVLSGEAAFERVVTWVDRNNAWDETALIITADHGHFFVIDDAETIAAAGRVHSEVVHSEESSSQPAK
ncbi:Alkaline phosphatase 3 precursor [Planctomycetes bacterium CA13]|uniref:Alkaline phosphatase 3 n=1 Tax=Novipirellula herctigrandis TaxID=2527986 RepID=A0A5C5Z6Q0_9BACT|nr:Alkaline phosphatase 3 precursor [Planctomycetes bacterium CA13]